jgi:putative lipoic acid-binding regulatory protein
MSDEQQAKGFQFPGVFEIMAAGPAEARLEEVIPRELAAAGLTVVKESVRSRASSAGRFVSVTVSFEAKSRADFDAAHVALRAHPDVKWTL